MAVSPGEKRYGEAALTLQSATGGTRAVTVTASGGAYPAKNLASGTTSITVSVAEVTGGVGPPTGTWGIAAVEDNTDVTGDYNGPATVLGYLALGAGGALAGGTIAIGKRGNFRLVLCVGNNAANAQDLSAVTTGATANYHFDSDNNNANGTLVTDSISGTRVTGYSWRDTKVASRSYSQSGNLRYGHTSTITVGFDTGTYINPKPIKVALKTSGADGTPQDGIYRPTPSTAGSATTSAFSVDTDFLAASTPYFLHVAMGDARSLGFPL